MILILSHPDDIHARAVMAHLGAGAPPVRLLDLSRFPRAAWLALRYGRDTSQLAYVEADGEPLDLDHVRAAWWRRPQPYGFEPGLTAAEFALAECDEAVAGLWLAMQARWMNPPVLDAAASRKSWQLRLAGDLGLSPPETLVTNCPDSAAAFVDRIGDVVYKPFAGTPRHWRETRRFGAEEMRQIAQLRHAPAILQERIPGEDIRVTVVGDAIFAAVIDSSGGSYDTDFRMNQDVRIAATDIPPDIEAAIHALMDRQGLVYGALDFRRTPEGEWRFLEINPAGQWLFVEEQTGQPIAKAVAGQLAAMAA